MSKAIFEQRFIVIGSVSVARRLFETFGMNIISYDARAGAIEHWRANSPPLCSLVDSFNAHIMVSPRCRMNLVQKRLSYLDVYVCRISLNFVIITESWRWDWLILPVRRLQRKERIIIRIPTLYIGHDHLGKQRILLPISGRWKFIFKRGPPSDGREEDQNDARDLMLKSPVFSFSLCCRWIDGEVIRSKANVYTRYRICLRRGRTKSRCNRLRTPHAKL